MTAAGRQSLGGASLALLIFGAWLSSLLFLLGERAPVLAWWLPLAILGRTFLHTGLFIVAHDAIHGSLWPSSRRLNHALGWVAAAAYALFPLARLAAAHHTHHAAPGSAADPDFAPAGQRSFWRWYLGFMRRYLSLGQLAGLALLFNVAEHGLGVPAPRLLLFWVLPSLLSTLQLFYFGTYLPHRPGREPFADHHHARSTAQAPWRSLLACYHFGRHWQHHAVPGVPWWRLHRVPPPPSASR